LNDFCHWPGDNAMEKFSVLDGRLSFFLDFQFIFVFKHQVGQN